MSENLKLCETHRAIQADLKRLEPARGTDSTVRQALYLSPTNRSDHRAVKIHYAENTGDEEWPKPPPPVAYDEPETMNQCDRQKLHNYTRAISSFSPQLTVGGKDNRI